MPQLSGNQIAIGPSILSADFRRLGEQVQAVAAAGADFIHVDVMDGVFVPNISVGFPIIEAVRAATELPIDVHLMIVEPGRWIERFAAAGADTITVQDRKSTRLNSSHTVISYAVFCLKKKKKKYYILYFKKKKKKKTKNK